MNTPPRRQPGEIIFTLLLVVGSVFMLWEAYGISRFDAITSAGVFPMMATGTMVVAALIALRGSLRKPPPAQTEGQSLARQFAQQITPPVLVGFTAVIAGYMLLLEPLGFVLASYLFLVMSMGLLGSRRWGLNLVVSAVTLGAIYLVFQTAFSVVLPKGRWLAGWLS